jgi:hypothetical protein
MSEGFSNTEGIWPAAPSIGVDPYLREREIIPKLAQQDQNWRDLRNMGWGYDNNKERK